MFQLMYFEITLKQLKIKMIWNFCLTTKLLMSQKTNSKPLCLFVIVWFRAKKTTINSRLFVCLFSDQAHVTPLRNWHFAQLAPVHGWSGHLLSVGISTETEGRICPTRRVGSAGTGQGSRPRWVRGPASGRKYFGDGQSAGPALRLDLQTQFGVSLSSAPHEVK
jgi:hypothetical protein